MPGNLLTCKQLAGVSTPRFRSLVLLKIGGYFVPRNPRWECLAPLSPYVSLSPACYNASVPRKTPIDHLTVVNMAEAGSTTSEIARALRISPPTVRSILARRGVAPKSGVDPAITRSLQERNAAKRAILSERALIEAGQFLDKLAAPTMVFAFGGKDNDYNERLLSQPPIPDQRNLMQAFSIAVKASSELERRDLDESANARSMLSDLADALGILPRESTLSLTMTSGPATPPSNFDPLQPDLRIVDSPPDLS